MVGERTVVRGSGPWREAPGRARHRAGDERPLELLVLLGRHSLLVYFAHIAIVYGRHPASMRSLVGPTLAWGPCLGSWLAVTAAMFGLAVAWERRKGWIAAVSPGAPRGPGGAPK